MSRLRRLAAIAFLAGLLPHSARAHDIPNARVDRSIQATLTPGHLAIDYEVSLSELTLTRDLRQLVGELPGVDPQGWFAAYGRETGPLNGRGLRVVVDRVPIEMRFLGFDVDVEEHPRYLFHYEAQVPRRGLLTVDDTNFDGSEGTSRLAIRGRDGIALQGDDLPPDVDAIAIRPVWQLSEVEERRTKRVEVTYDEGTEARAVPSAVFPRPRPAEFPVRPPLPRPAIRPGNTRLSRLLDRDGPVSVLMLGVIALGLGAVHALQPGHGKTLVAATVLGEGGTWFRGALLSIATTLAHTGSVLLVAVALWWTRTTRYGEIHLGLAHAAGVLIASIGLWRLGRHLAGHGEHDVSSGMSSEPSSARRQASTKRGLLGLGVAGGLVPCWDAVVLIVLAEATGRLALGIGLLIAFGLGMAVVLVVVGVLAARIRHLLTGGDGAETYGVWERRLGVLSGLTLAAIGVYLFGLA